MQWRRAALSYLNDVRAHKRLVGCDAHLDKSHFIALMSKSITIFLHIKCGKTAILTLSNERKKCFLCQCAKAHCEMCFISVTPFIKIVVLSIFYGPRHSKRESAGKKGAIDYVRFSSRIKKEKRGLSLFDHRSSWARGCSCAQLKIGAISLCITQS